MDGAVSIAPHKRRKVEIDYKLCFICQDRILKEDLVDKPQLKSIELILNLSRERHAYGDPPVAELVQRTRDLTPLAIFQNKASYHRSCYKEYGNKQKLVRVKERYEKALQNKDASLSQNRVGRPSLGTSPSVEEDQNKRTLRSTAGIFNKALCIICQKHGGALREVMYKATGESMLQVAKKHADDSVFRRLNSIATPEDSVAIETKYHLRCWVMMKRQVQQMDNSVETQEIDDTHYVIADIEVINYLRQELDDPSHKVITTTQVEIFYLQLLLQSGLKEEDLNKSYKKYLRQLILENIDNVSFTKSPRVNEPDRICSTMAGDHALDMALQQSEAERFEEIYNAAMIIRTELGKMEKWIFTGSFKDFTAPIQLSTLIRWIVHGPTVSLENKSENKQNSITKVVDVVTQMVTQSFLSTRQVTYKSKAAIERDSMYSKIETPLNIGVGLYLHQATRSKKLIDMFADLNLSSNYDKVTLIKKDIAATILKQRDVHNGVFIPSCLQSGIRPFFGIDNTDIKIDTPTGKQQLHGTAMAVFQQSLQPKPKVVMKIERKSGRHRRDVPFYEDLTVFEPAKKSLTQPDSYLDDITNNSTEMYRNFDLVWCLMKSLCSNLGDQVPTWAAYNSLITVENPITTFCSLPIISGSPTDWDNLFTSLKEVQKVNSSLAPGTSTVVTFDLQLYSKAMQLQLNSDIDESFVIRMGELHVVFTALKVLGKMINGSGLDQAFEEALIYGSATVEQIKDGKHLYRCLEAHQMLYLSIFEKYISSMIESYPTIEKDLRDVIISGISIVENHGQETKETLVKKHEDLLNVLSSTKFSELQAQFDESIANQGKFLRNYMRLFETLLLFIRASRQQDWQLHLESLHSLCQYFFAFDMVNYARLTPVYLAKMFSLKESDPDTWKMFSEGNFSVNKSIVPFSAIGVDHAVEQENRAVKVLGGIKGIANNQSALDEYFLTTSEMGNIIEDFCDVFNIQGQAPKRSHHYQLTGSKSQRLNEGVKKLAAVFSEHEVGFDETELVYNVITKKVLPENLSTEFLAAEEEGKKLYEQFVKQRIVGETSIWETITKRKLPTFTSNMKIVQMKVQNQLVNIRAERKLMSRFLIAARARPDIDLPGYLGKYEFSAVPRSLFTSEGELLACHDKSKITTEMLECLQPEEVINESCEDGVSYKVIVFDGMAVANKINIKKMKLKLCSGFAFQFTERIKRESRGFHEVRVIFDRYIESSLKAGTRSSRTGGTSVRYKVADDTVIAHLSTKKFLSNIHTKNDLTEYLSLKLQQNLQNDFSYVVSFRNTCLTNIPGLDPELRDHTHEEADTCIVLHALDITRRDPFSDVVVNCSDTDVLLLLLHYFEDLCSSTIFRTSNRDIHLRAVHSTLGPEMCATLLGFHAITGCDQTGRFSGFGKTTCWEVLKNASTNVTTSLQKMGEGDITDDVKEGLEEFVLDLYCKGRPAGIDSLASLRWYLFSRCQSENERLPPTAASLWQKILRANFTATQWKLSHVARPVLDSPTQHGWTWDDKNGVYNPVMTELSPAPESVVELSMCRTCTTGCKTLRCKCKKNRIVCTEMCLCKDCENIEEDRDLEDFVEE